MISFVIPTRNGMPYLEYSVRSVLELESDNFELIVAVNDINEETSRFLEQIKDNRIKVVKPGAPLSISANYEFALSHASGEWIQFLGSDDAICPGYIEDIDNILKRFPTIQVINWVRALYFWPNLEHQYGNAVLSYRGSARVELKSTRFLILRTLLGINSMFENPQLYTNSLVKKDLIDLIKSKSGGVFFNGIIPDIYSSVAIMSNCPYYVRVHNPLTIVGSSASSIGIGTRVYEEEAVESSSRRALEESISPNLHKMKFQPYFFLESVRKYRKVTAGHNCRLENWAVVLGMGVQPLSKPQRTQFRKDFYYDSERRTFSRLWWVVAQICGTTLRGIIYTVRLLSRFKNKYFRNNSIINSINRFQYPDILKAADAIWRAGGDLK